MRDDDQTAYNADEQEEHNILTNLLRAKVRPKS